MYRITCRVGFEAAHRLRGYNGLCAYVHGHHYVVEATVESRELDHLSMVTDFSELKQVLRACSSERMDHRLVLNPDDDPTLLGLGGVCVMHAGNPTAENMAREIYRSMILLIPDHTRLVNIRIYETPDCWCDYHE